MKRGLFCLLAAALLCLPALAEETGFQRVNTYWIGQFSDVSGSTWCADNVRTAYEFGIMTGKTDSWFDTEGSLTIGQAIAMACRLHSGYGGSVLTVEHTNPWYQAYVDYAWAHQIITGTYENYNLPISRAGFSVILGASLPDEALPVISGIEEGIIPDIPEDAACYSAVYRLYRAGILTGNDAKGTFAPYEHISRGAAAAIVSRMADPTLRKAITLGDPFMPVAVESLANLESLRGSATDEELKAAWSRAVELVRPYAKAGRYEQLNRVARALRALYEEGRENPDPGYDNPYGFFVLGASTDAGAARAAGLCLNILGIPYEHVHEGIEDQHQWCRVEVAEGVYWICDPAGSYCGPESGPYGHPYHQT